MVLYEVLTIDIIQTVIKANFDIIVRVFGLCFCTCLHTIWSDIFDDDPGLVFDSA